MNDGPTTRDEAAEYTSLKADGAEEVSGVTFDAWVRRKRAGKSIEPDIPPNNDNCVCDSFHCCSFCCEGHCGGKQGVHLMGKRLGRAYNEILSTWVESRARHLKAERERDHWLHLVKEATGALEDLERYHIDHVGVPCDWHCVQETIARVRKALGVVVQDEPMCACHDVFGQGSGHLASCSYAGTR